MENHDLENSSNAALERRLGEPEKMCLTGNVIDNPHRSAVFAVGYVVKLFTGIGKTDCAFLRIGASTEMIHSIC